MTGRETMKILVLNPFAVGMRELERCRHVAGAVTLHATDRFG